MKNIYKDKMSIEIDSTCLVSNSRFFYNRELILGLLYQINGPVNPYPLLRCTVQHNTWTIRFSHDLSQHRSQSDPTDHVLY
jgi:hypothetical protein